MRSAAGTQDVLVVVERTACNDTMSGQAFEATVAITFENTAMYGCGEIVDLSWCGRDASVPAA